MVDGDDDSAGDSHDADVAHGDHDGGDDGDGDGDDDGDEDDAQYQSTCTSLCVNMRNCLCSTLATTKEQQQSYGPDGSGAGSSCSSLLGVPLRVLLVPPWL